MCKQLAVSAMLCASPAGTRFSTGLQGRRRSQQRTLGILVRATFKDMNDFTVGIVGDKGLRLPGF